MILYTRPESRWLENRLDSRNVWLRPARTFYLGNRGSTTYHDSQNSTLKSAKKCKRFAKKCKKIVKSHFTPKSSKKCPKIYPILESRIGPIPKNVDRVESRKFFSPSLLDRPEPEQIILRVVQARIEKIWNRSMPSIDYKRDDLIHDVVYCWMVRSLGQTKISQVKVRLGYIGYGCLNGGRRPPLTYP